MDGFSEDVVEKATLEASAVTRGARTTNDRRNTMNVLVTNATPSEDMTHD